MHNIEIERLIMSHMMTWDLFDKNKVARPNRNFEPPKDGVWCRVTIIGGINHIACVSDKACVREYGSLIVQFFDRENNGTKELKTQADSLARHFGCVMLDKLDLLAPSIVDVGVGGGFYQINVGIPYRYN